MAKYVIIGGHGKVAQLLEPMLVDAGHEVVALIRNEDHREDIERTGAKAELLSVEDENAFELMSDVFTNAAAIIWSAGAGGKGGPERSHAVDNVGAKKAIDAAKNAGVPHFVMVSFVGSVKNHGVSEDDPMHAYTVAKVEADSYLVESGLSYTILGPGVLTEEDPSGQIAVGRPDEGQSSDTSRANVALMIQESLSNPGALNQIVPFRDGSTPIADAVSGLSGEFTLDD